MKESKDPRSLRNTVHISSNLTNIAAAVLSMVSGFSASAGSNCEMDVIGGAL